MFKVRHADWDQRVRESFAQQVMAESLGLRMADCEAGRVVLEMPFNPSFVQQHGFHHAGVTTTGMDSACGYAAMSLMDADAEVLTVEFKSSLLAPAAGELFRYEGRVIRAGRTLLFTEGRAEADGKLIATMSATMMAVRGLA
ncbi:MAG: PaaI family thioesterase [Rhodobacteraceae bacterium]|nr:PaaI family thioesterase [Paracoccaceae bacterium]